MGRTLGLRPWLLAPLCLVLAVGACRGGAIKESRATYESQGKRIKVERYAPKQAGKHPAVIVLYGSGGLLPRGDGIQGISRQLASRGYAAFLPHYFDDTGGKVPRVIDHETTGIWLTTIADAVAYAAGQPNVDPERIGLVGFSMGGSLALVEASRDDKVKAVVEYFAGMPGGLKPADVKRMPPTLIIHGDADPVVPIAEAREVEKFLEATGTVHDIKIYPGQGHAFAGEAWPDSQRVAGGFLDEHLKQKRATSEGRSP